MNVWIVLAGIALLAVVCVALPVALSMAARYRRWKIVTCPGAYRPTAILIGRAGLAEMVGANPQGSGFSGVVFNYIVRSEARVDEVMDEARRAGATILKPAAKLQWGGYGGTFADPDGYIWNIAYSAVGENQPYAE